MIRDKILREVHDEMLRETRKLEERQDVKFQQFSERNKNAFIDAENSRDLIIKHFDSSLDLMTKNLNDNIKTIKEDVSDIKTKLNSQDSVLGNHETRLTKLEEHDKTGQKNDDKVQNYIEKVIWAVLGLVLGYIAIKTGLAP